jgi:hypothetical protein
MSLFNPVNKSLTTVFNWKPDPIDLRFLSLLWKPRSFTVRFHIRLHLFRFVSKKSAYIQFFWKRTILGPRKQPQLTPSLIT